MIADKRPSIADRFFQLNLSKGMNKNLNFHFQHKRRFAQITLSKTYFPEILKSSPTSN